MTPEARKIAAAWDPAADEASGNQCKPYGAAAIMRVPTRLHVTWTGENTLRIDTDAGTQTRLFHFEKNPFVEEMTKKYQVPRDAVLGFPETLYPEYRKKMKGMR